MEWCARCDNGRFVCENHPDRPFFGGRACDCGGAGDPCPACNPSEVTTPEMPEDFREDLNIQERPFPRRKIVGGPSFWSPVLLGWRCCRGQRFQRRLNHSA
jgi:hypothetical protein